MRNVGPSVDVVASDSEIPPVSLRRGGDFVVTEDDNTLRVVDRLDPPSPRYIIVGTGPSNPVARSVLTVGSTVPAGPGVYATWSLLWAAYLQTSGAVDIVVVGSVSVPAGSYTIRNATRIRGVIAQSNLNLQDGAVLVDAQEVMGCQVNCNSSSSTFEFSSANASMLLRDGAAINQSGSAPCILWTEPRSAGQLAIVLTTGGAFSTTNGNPVLSAEGTGPDPDDAVVILLAGSYSNLATARSRATRTRAFRSKPSSRARSCRRRSRGTAARRRSARCSSR